MPRTGCWGARVAAAFVALALGACGGDEDIAYEFESLGGENEMDQVLWLEHGADVGLAPKLALTPLDGEGDEIPGVKVHTAFGSDEGRLVIPPKAAVIDILRFSGKRARDVEDVELEVPSLERVETTEPAPEAVDITRIDSKGRPFKAPDGGGFFDAVRVDNPSAGSARVRVALIEWEDPPPGQPQQAARVTPLSDLLQVPGKDSKTITLPPELRGQVVGSVKAYYSK